MNVLIVYDSSYGNTAKIAQAIGHALADDAAVLPVGGVKEADLEGADYLIAGSPTQGGRQTKALEQFLKEMPAGSLRGVQVAAFDTRFAAGEHGFGLRLLMKLLGYAAPRIAAGLKAKGGKLLAPPEGFIVHGKDGPLAEGEIERAAAWARALLQNPAPTENRGTR